MDDVEQVRGWVGAADRIAVLAGAGMSTASGIPDFRGPQGLWTQRPETQRLFSLDAYVTDPEVRRTSWRNRRDHAAWTARPNAGHCALAALETTGRLLSVATQNIDGLQQAAGSRRVLELHGTLHETVCLDCGDRRTMAEALGRLEDGEVDPSCLVCGGILKAATVSFGQQLDRRVLLAATVSARECDLYLAVGSTLSVHPAAGLCDVAIEQGARLVIVNDGETPYDGVAAARLAGRIEQVLPEIVGAALTGSAGR